MSRGRYRTEAQQVDHPFFEKQRNGHPGTNVVQGRWSLRLRKVQDNHNLTFLSFDETFLV